MHSTHLRWLRSSNCASWLTSSLVMRAVMTAPGLNSWLSCGMVFWLDTSACETTAGHAKSCLFFPR
jgi:hypothetical protein